MIRFGTSGFRGIMGAGFTKESVKRVAYALCKIIKEDKVKNPRIVIGYDNRFMSPDYAKWVAEVLSVCAEVVFCTVPAPSPMICYKAKNMTFGIAITASHNPFYYNGIKVFLPGGRDADDAFAKRIESYANEVNPLTIEYNEYEEALKKNIITEDNDYKSYCDDILSGIDTQKIKSSGLRILANPMHGNSVDCIKYILNKMGLKTSSIINGNPDPYFGGKLPSPYVQNLKEQAEMVVSNKFDLGIALDGDGDRFTLIGRTGKVFDCNYVLAVLYYYYIKVKGYKGGVVKNIALTSLIDKLAVHLGFKCYEARVGFKNIVPILAKTDAFIGGESNGISLKKHLLTKDGVFIAATVIEMLAILNQPFEQVLKEIQEEMDFKSEIVEVAYPVGDEQRKHIEKLLFKEKRIPEFSELKVKEALYAEGLKINYAGGYWGVIRFSGNEPVVRIFAEMQDIQQCERMLGCYEQFIGVKTRQV